MRIRSKPNTIPIAAHLYLREATTDDAFSLFQLIEESRAYLREWLPFIDTSTNVSDTKQYLKYVTSPENDTDKVFCIVYLEEVVGLVGFKDIDNLNQKLEIGYWLGEQYQHRGIMIRSCQHLLYHAFITMNMNRIQIRVGVGNNKSSQIPKKLGFTLEGIQREGELLNGKFHNLEVYSLLKSEWMEQ